jgi:hypothetical protein
VSEAKKSGGAEPVDRRHHRCRVDAPDADAVASVFPADADIGDLGALLRHLGLS